MNDDELSLWIKTNLKAMYINKPVEVKTNKATYQIVKAGNGDIAISILAEGSIKNVKIKGEFSYE